MTDSLQIRWSTSVGVVFLPGFIAAQEADRGAKIMKLLLQRQEYQRLNSKGLTTFHDFEFKDGYAQSQITLPIAWWTTRPKIGNPPIMIMATPWQWRV